MAKSICNLDKSIFIKTILLISIVLLLAYILNYASSNKIMEALTTQCDCRGPNFVATDSGCGSVGAPCCREPNKADPQPLCAGGPCGCHGPHFVTANDGCGNVGAPCCREPNKADPHPICSSAPASSPSGKCVPNIPALAAAGNPNLNVIAATDCKNIKTKAKCGPLGLLCPACCTWQEAPTPKPTPTTLPSSPTLESCKQKCEEHQAAGCKGVVYDAIDKKCWFKNFFAGEGEAKANRQAFILNPGCPKPKVPVPPPKPACCKGWQQTLNCSGSGPPDTRSAFLQSSTHGSHGCKVNIPSGASGYCTCRDGKKLLFDCGHSGFNCEEQCAKNCTEAPVQQVHVSSPPKTNANCKTPPAPHPAPPKPKPS